MSRCPGLPQKEHLDLFFFGLAFASIQSSSIWPAYVGDCYRCVPPDPGIAAAALGASESGTLPGTAPAQALHTFTLDSGASRCFFRDSTTLTPLPAPVLARPAEPSWGPVVARSSTFLPCPAVLSGSLSGLHLPSFSTNLVSTAALQNAMVTTNTPGGQRVPISTCTRTGRYLATFTRVAASCSCCLSHQNLLWHHRLGHPSLPRLCGMHSRLVVSCLPRSLPPLPPSPAPPCLLCVEGQKRAAPHSPSFPPTSAPLQTLHIDVWGPARVSGQGRKRYFLLVVDDYTRYTMVFPLRSKGQVVDVLIPWIRTVRLQLRERFGQDLSDLRLHSDRGGEFSSNLLRDFCRGEGILQSFTLPDSPQQNGIGERRIGLVMEVARTSMIHAVAPHFLWLFAVQYVAHQLNLWPRVSLPETSPTLRWTGKVGDASVFRVWGSRAFVRDPSADKLSACAIPCGPAPSGVSQVDPPPGAVLGEVAVDSGAARGTVSGGAELGSAGPGGAEPGGAEIGGAESGGVETGGAEPGGAEPEGVEPGGATSEGAESGGAEPQGAALSGGSAGASLRLSLQQLREWFVQRARLWSGATGAGGAGAGGAGVAAGAGARAFAEKGIKHKISLPYAHQQQVVVERIVPARDILFYERLTLHQWIEDQRGNITRAYANNSRSFVSPEDEAAAAALDRDPADKHPGVSPRPRDDDNGNDAPAPGPSHRHAQPSSSTPAPEGDDADVVEVTTTEAKSASKVTGLQLLGLHTAVTTIARIVEPKNLRHALTSPHAKEWRAAIDAQL
ncbi:unnamed protein product [Closterium sp. NIES-54]